MPTILQLNNDRLHKVLSLFTLLIGLPLQNYNLLAKKIVNDYRSQIATTIGRIQNCPETPSPKFCPSITILVLQHLEHGLLASVMAVGGMGEPQVYKSFSDSHSPQD